MNLLFNNTKLIYYIIFFLFYMFIITNIYIVSKFMYLKLIFNILIFFIISYLFKQTFVGKKIILFFNKTRLELIKVAWPSLQDVIKSTFLILILSFLYSLLIYFFDKIILTVMSNIIKRG